MLQIHVMPPSSDDIPIPVPHRLCENILLGRYKLQVPHADYKDIFSKLEVLMPVLGENLDNIPLEVTPLPLLPPTEVFPLFLYRTRRFVAFYIYKKFNHIIPPYIIINLADLRAKPSSVT
jgi:hypothetical protein